jgi:quinol-cytochrome oxidoreductase complex cytochrome b subunit
VSDEHSDGRRDLIPLVTGVVLALEVVALATTGVVLFFVYRPTRPGVVELPEIARALHRFVSWAIVPTAVAHLAATLAGRLGRRSRRVAPGVGVLVGSAAASFTGFLLPWDQVALWAVVVGPGVRGYRSVFSDAARFYLIGPVEVGVDTMQRWLGVHVALGAAVAALAGAIVIRVVRRPAER